MTGTVVEASLRDGLIRSLAYGLEISLGLLHIKHSRKSYCGNVGSRMEIVLPEESIVAPRLSLHFLSIISWGGSMTYQMSLWPLAIITWGGSMDLKALVFQAGTAENVSLSKS